MGDSSITGIRAGHVGRLFKTRCMQWAVASLLSFGVTVVLAARVHAQAPSLLPELRIEAESHTAEITQIATDAQDRYIVTASGDKTVRVWEMASGRLLRVLRPPVGEGYEGKMVAVALSPDGRTVA